VKLKRKVVFPNVKKQKALESQGISKLKLIKNVKSSVDNFIKQQGQLESSY
jgi:hypothetical protein